MNTLAVSALVIVGVLELGLFWWMARGLRNQRGLEERVNHLADAVSLLTETTETGFRAAASEIGRLAGGLETPRRPEPARRPAGARATGARARGKSVEQVAAGERMSEGEAHLRARLRETAAEAGAAKASARRKPRRREAAA